MGHRVLRASESFWRPSNAMKVANTDLAKQLEATRLGARFWRLEPGQASTKHRHREVEELYVVIEGTGRMRLADEVLTLEVHDCVLVDAPTVRQVFNDTDAPQLWLVVGAPTEAANTLEMTAEDLAWYYPDGTTALPPELAGEAG